MNARHRKTYNRVHQNPALRNITWNDVEAMFNHLGTVIEGSGSRVNVEINGVDASFHRPHPEKEIKVYVVKKIRAFLAEAGVE